MARPREDEAGRFWLRVTIPSNVQSDCWVWSGRRLSNGYGQFSRAGAEGGQVSAHRYSFEAFNGPVPAGLHVLHSCDVRSCVNPAHLRAGTHADNMRDRNERGRQAKGSAVVGANQVRGERVGGAKLSAGLVREIRAAWAGRIESQSAMARRLGVRQSAVSAVCLRKTWAHVE